MIEPRDEIAEINQPHLFVTKELHRVLAWRRGASYPPGDTDQVLDFIERFDNRGEARLTIDILKFTDNITAIIHEVYDRNGHLIERHEHA